MKINKYIDHTLLKANALKSDIEKLCSEAKEYDFFAVCVNPCWVTLCKELLAETEVKVCTVIGFPLGATTTLAKAEETKVAVANGADELDMVINIGWLKSQEYQLVVEDIRAVVASSGGKIVKVIIETCLLSDEEKIKACELIMQAKADFVKTSTGFSTSGATVADIALLKETVKDRIYIKAAGGVSNVDDLLAMVKNGANRIGTSRGVELMKMAEGQSVEISKGY